MLFLLAPAILANPAFRLLEGLSVESLKGEYRFFIVGFGGFFLDSA
jgi:hypothetical protein